VSLSHFPPAPEPSDGFSADELKLLLVAVRHMRRTFAQAQKAKPDPALAAYAALYDSLFEKLRALAGPLPETVGGPLK
jgi:hypothetical protein